MEGLKLWPDIDMTRKFLDQIAPDGAITFQTVGDRTKAPGLDNPRLRRVFHGSLDDHLAALIAYNNAGAGIFFMVNRGDGIVKDKARTCRTTANVCSVRALFVDLDGSPLEPVLKHSVPPSIVVESSPGRWHAYWPTPNIKISEFSGFQRRLADLFNGDPSVHDLPRVMRLPGFWHQKRAPFMTSLIS